MVKKVQPQPPAFFPAEWTTADVAAFQALAQGKADEAQQKRALNWILYEASNVYDLEYRTESRDHAFCSGRRFVGLQVIKMLKLNLATLTGKIKDD